MMKDHTSLTVMGAYLFAHRVTGEQLYTVGDATQEQIDMANQNLKARLSEYRYIPAEIAPTRLETLEQPIYEKAHLGS